jgi:PAS domain S-box-containing protein
MLQILLLEDDPIDCELISKTLRKNGLESHIIRVNNRQAFLEHLQTRPPDLILADYVLPTFDGLAAMELAQASCPEVPFILVSGVLGEEQAIDALKRGATDYVLKQRLERLGPAVERALREQRERRERQLVAKALRQTDDLLSAIVHASPVGIITLNREGLVMTWNPTAEKIYGWSASSIVDRPLPLISVNQQADFASCFNQALDNATLTNLEFTHIKQDGSPVEISLSLAPLHDGDNSIYGVVMTTVDITFHKQIEVQRQVLLEQERQARAAAETANRLKDEFLAVLSHELRTPLNAIVGWIKLIQKGGLKPQVLQRAFDTIERNALVQTQLIEDLLDISRIIRGQVNLTIHRVDVSRLIQTTVDTLRPAAEAKSIQVKLNLDANIGHILADANRLQQVFWNLLLNAIKFTPAGGTVDVRGQMLDNQLSIQVQDSGIGIAPEFVPHMFDYFRQADSSTTRSQGGLGLGLAITRRLIELHGGTIQVDSPGIGQGSTFTVYLPVRLPQPALTPTTTSLHP